MDEIYVGDYAPAAGAVVEEMKDRLSGSSAPGSGENIAVQSSMLVEDTLPDLISKVGPMPEVEEFINRTAPPLLVVLSGPSGVGKDVTLKRMDEMGVPFHYAVTVTTRKQRRGEINGKDYHFVSKVEYERMLANGELLEYKEIYGNSYGIPCSEVIDPLRLGEDVIMKPDVQGARTIRELEPEAVFIFLAPPSIEEQARRLFYRKTEDPQELATRLDAARQEMHELTHFDYLVINRNGKLDETVETIKSILLAEKCKVHPRKIRLAEKE